MLISRKVPMRPYPHLRPPSYYLQHSCPDQLSYASLNITSSFPPLDLCTGFSLCVKSTFPPQLQLSLSPHQLLLNFHFLKAVTPTSDLKQVPLLLYSIHAIGVPLTCAVISFLPLDQKLCEGRNHVCFVYNCIDTVPSGNTSSTAELKN